MNSANYHTRYYREVRRPRALAYAGDGNPECAWCGASEDLQFDHVDPSQKAFDISRNLTVSNSAVQNELAKCQLLCRRCHEQKTAAERTGMTHGGWYAWMTRKCACSECESARENFNRGRREARRVCATSPGPTAKRYENPPACGEFRKYRKGCRCDLCRGANAAKQAAYQANRKSANS